MHDGKKFPVPKYYDKLLQRRERVALDELKALREFKAVKVAGDRTDARLAVREEVAKGRLAVFKRRLEDG